MISAFNIKDGERKLYDAMSSNLRDMKLQSWAGRATSDEDTLIEALLPVAKSGSVWKEFENTYLRMSKMLVVMRPGLSTRLRQPPPRKSTLKDRAYSLSRRTRNPVQLFTSNKRQKI